MRDDIKYLRRLAEIARGWQGAAKTADAIGYFRGRAELCEELIRLLCPHESLRQGKVLAETGGPHVICDECGQRYL